MSNTNFDETTERKKMALEVSSFHNPAVWDQMQKMAQTFIQSNALTSDVKNAPQIMMKLQAGYEMGMQAVEALQSLYIVNGRIAIWGVALSRRLVKFGYKIEYPESTDKKCTVRVSKGDFSAEETVTIDGVPKSKRDNSFAYKDYPRRKLRWDALKLIVDFHTPDVLGAGGMDIVDEEEIEVIDHDTGKVEVVTKKKGSKKETTEVEDDVEAVDEPTMSEVADKNESNAKEAEVKKEEQAAEVAEDVFTDSDQPLPARLAEILAKKNVDPSPILDEFMASNFDELTESQLKHLIKKYQ